MSIHTLPLLLILLLLLLLLAAVAALHARCRRLGPGGVGDAVAATEAAGGRLVLGGRVALEARDVGERRRGALALSGEGDAPG